MSGVWHRACQVCGATPTNQDYTILLTSVKHLTAESFRGIMANRTRTEPEPTEQGFPFQYRYYTTFVPDCQALDKRKIRWHSSDWSADRSNRSEVGESVGSEC